MDHPTAPGAAISGPAAQAGVEAARHLRTVDRDALLAACVVLLVAAVLQLTPARDGVSVLGWQLPEVCGTKRLFGASCPGCGLTRSFVVGVRGDLAGAFQLHPLGPLLLLFTAAQLPYRAALLTGLLQRRALAPAWLARRQGRALAVGVVAALAFTSLVRLLGGIA